MNRAGDRWHGPAPQTGRTFVVTGASSDIGFGGPALDAARARSRACTPTTPERSHSALLPPPAPSRARALLRVALLAGGLTFAALLLLPQLREVPAALDAFASADPRWMAIAAACALSTYAAGALALQALTASRLPLARNLQVQLASAAAGALTPAGAGGLALHVHFLERYGLPRPQAIAAVSVGRLTAAGVHLITLLLLLPGLTRRTGTIGIPAALPIALLLSAALGSLLLQRLSARARRLSHRLLLPLRVALRWVLTDPRRIVALLGGSLLVGACRALTFTAALRSLGAEVPFLAVVALFLAAEALGALSSTPGGLGVLDGVLLTGVITLGAAPASGLGAVLLFRLLTLWGPLLPGLLAARLLRPGS
jgi:glycosyltransferase 2 family protein